MKKILPLIIFLSCLFASGQNEKVTFDEVIPEFVLNLWDGKTTLNGNEYSFKELDQIKAFFEELKLKENQIVSDKFLKKPTDNTLVAYYLNTKLRWNSFNFPGIGLKKLKSKQVIKKSLKELPLRYELLAFYYSGIFIDALNKRKPMNLAGVNIDLNSLNLYDDTEKTILFLSAMRHLGGQVSGYSETKFPNNCFRAEKYVENLPKFNGKAFYQFSLPEFDDFLIEVDKRYPKSSFKKRYIPEFENAKTSYGKCLDTKSSE